jgi:hypothetical protein
MEGIDVNVFDHEQQSMRKLVIEDKEIAKRAKLINERVCNSYYPTTDPSVLSAFPTWNTEDNLYQKGDFVVQFAGRSFQQRKLDMERLQ